MPEGRDGGGGVGTTVTVLRGGQVFAAPIIIHVNRRFSGYPNRDP